MQPRTYIAIDLKSFYASVECRERGLDPMNTNLVVADESRTEKTICLAVTPSLKAYGIPGRARLFEVIQHVNTENARRRLAAPGHQLTGSSCFASELKASPALAVDYIVAPPRMAYYMEYSTRIYNIYLKYIAPEDIVVYSIDEVFMDVTGYLDTYGLSARELARTMILDVLQTTGITATAGIGPNLFLSKVAMDIGAKHIQPDENGVRIAELDEMSYRKKLWDHRPLTDFWRVGPGYARKLERCGLFTMGDVARCSVQNEDLLYSLFGKNAELLIDHAWGWEPCTIAAIKAYKPQSNSLGSGQVLQCPYPHEKARLVLREMAEQLALDLVDKGLVTDHYGRQIPKHGHGSENLGEHTSSGKQLLEAATALFERIAPQELLVRKLSLSANHVIPEAEAIRKTSAPEQLDLFTDYASLEKKEATRKAELEKERRMQQTMMSIKKKFGKNAILKGMSLEEGATARERNAQIGGHKA